MRRGRNAVADLYWSISCRASIEPRDQHYLCTGLWEQPNEDGTGSGEFTRCVCPCHDGFDPDTGER